MGEYRLSAMDDLGGDDTSFIADDVRDMIREVCDSIIKKETMFKQQNVEEHTAAVIEEVLKRLADQRKPFKYVVTCAITQRAGMGIHMATSTHWDPNHDGAQLTFTLTPCLSIPCRLRDMQMGGRLHVCNRFCLWRTDIITHSQILDTHTLSMGSLRAQSQSSLVCQNDNTSPTQAPQGAQGWCSRQSQICCGFRSI